MVERKRLVNGLRRTIAELLRPYTPGTERPAHTRTRHRRKKETQGFR